MGLTERVKACFKVAERVLGSSCHVDFGGREWPVFLCALDVRHRLMHPKSSGDLSVSVEEMQAVERARDRFREAAQRFFLAGQARMQAVFAKQAQLKEP